MRVTVQDLVSFRLSESPSKQSRWLTLIGPGLLVAATGVGAGDLAIGTIAGSRLGVAVLWAVVVGAGLKYLLTEGLARWQLVTGTTLLEGVVRHTGRLAGWLFLTYLIGWSYFVGVALMSACGIAAHAILPVLGPSSDRMLYGLIHSAVAVVMVERGGYRLFERVMSVCIGIMFVTVVAAAIAVRPALADVLRGLVVPSIPKLATDGLQWTVALMGGVGGTVTVLCYGYWIREEGRTTAADLGTCRIDLLTGYLMTALFGVAMVVLGSRVPIAPDSQGANLLVSLGHELRHQLGPFGSVLQWTFLIGAWGAIFSSLLGVWQSIPYLFADFMRITRGSAAGKVDVRSREYRWYLYGIASIPAAGLLVSFTTAQKLYAIVGACFLPLLAAALLSLNGRSALVGDRYRNGPLIVVLLTATLLVFTFIGCYEIQRKVFAEPAAAQGRLPLPLNKLSEVKFRATPWHSAGMSTRATVAERPKKGYHAFARRRATQPPESCPVDANDISSGGRNETSVSIFRSLRDTACLNGKPWYPLSGFASARP